MKNRGRFYPVGIAAIEPRAWGMFFDMNAPAPVARIGDLAIVSVRGPLMHHEDYCFDSYDAIKARVIEALEAKPSAIVLSIDSPGGLVSGCFDTADEIRQACDAAGVRLVSFIDGQACSAAYAIACVADTIVTPPTAEIGSIGCVAELVSFAVGDKSYVDRRIITSGARKADGNPNAPITDDAEKAIKERVMQLAELFFEHVAAHRPGAQVDDIRALEAGIQIGASAAPMLVDEVMSLDGLIAAIAAGDFEARGAEENEDMTIPNKSASATKAEGSEEKAPLAKAKEAYRASLQAIVDDKGADQKSKDDATAALATMDGDEPEADAPSTEEKPSKDDDEKDAKAIASEALAVARATSKTIADQKAADIETERASLLASRADLSDAERKILTKASIEDVRAYVKDQPKRKTKLGAVGVTVPITRGEGQGEEADAASGDPERKTAIAIAMGVRTEIVQPKFDGRRQTFPALNRAERAAYIAKREATKAEAIKKAQSAA